MGSSAAAPPPSAAGLVHRTCKPSRRPAEAAVGGHRRVEEREGDHAAQLPGRPAGPHVLEVPAPITPAADRHVAAQQQSRHELAAQARPRVDLPRDEPPQHVGALGVAHQHHAAAPVVAAQVGAPGLAHVPVGEGRACARRTVDAPQAQLPVDGRVHAAVLGVARGLVEGDRAQFGIDAKGRLRPRHVADRRVDIEAVHRTRPGCARARDPQLGAAGREDRGGEPGPAGVGLQAGPAEPQRVGCRRRRERRRCAAGQRGRREHHPSPPAPRHRRDPNPRAPERRRAARRPPSESVRWCAGQRTRNGPTYFQALPRLAFLAVALAVAALAAAAGTSSIALLDRASVHVASAVASDIWSSAS